MLFSVNRYCLLLYVICVDLFVIICDLCEFVRKNMPGLEKLVAGAFQALSAAVLVSSKNILPQVVKYKLLRQGQHPDEVAQLNSAKHEPQHAVQLCIAKCKLEK